jgi:hypothetical protein
MVEETITGTDKLLICLALILLLTIVWTILIGILYKMNERKYRRIEKKKKIIVDDYDLDDDYEDAKIVFKKRDKYKSRRLSNMETYVKVRFLRTKKDLIYVAPDDIDLVEGQRIKVRVDEDTVRSAIVVKGNYTREKYKNYEYNTLEVEEF